MSNSIEAGSPRRAPLSALSQVVIAVLLCIVLAAVLVAARIHHAVGHVPPPVILFLIVPVLMAGAAALGWRWVPFAAAALCGLLLVLLAPHLPRLLASPGDILFTPFVLLTGLGAAGLVAGGAAGVQNYGRRRRERDVPRWLPVKLSALAGVVAGMLLMGTLVQPGAAAGVSADVLEQLPAIETERFEFTQQELRVRAGETVALRLVNRDGTAHSFDVDEFDVHAPMPPNATGVAIFKAGRPGTYTFYCAPHYDAKTGEGMKGTLIVEP